MANINTTIYQATRMRSGMGLPLRNKEVTLPCVFVCFSKQPPHAKNGTLFFLASGRFSVHICFVFSLNNNSMVRSERILNDKILPTMLMTNVKHSSVVHCSLTHDADLGDNTLLLFTIVLPAMLMISATTLFYCSL